MSYADNCYYREWVGTNGWRWRLELRPASSDWQNNRAGGTGDWAVWEKLQDDVFLPESVDEITAGFEKLPIGLASAPTMKLKFDTALASDDLFDVLYSRIAPAYAQFSLGPEGDIASWRIYNTWILRTDYGDGADYTIGSIPEGLRSYFDEIAPGALPFAPVYFIGVQRGVRSPTTTVGLGKQTAEIVVENLLFSIVRSWSVFDYGKRLLHRVLVEADPFTYKVASRAYEYAFQIAGKSYLLLDSPGLTSTMVMISLLVLNNAGREFLNELYGFYRVAASTLTGDMFANDHLKLFRQSYTPENEPGAELNSGEDTRYLIAVVLQSVSPVAGLLVPATSRAAGFEGETMLDAIENWTVSVGAKLIWQTSSLYGTAILTLKSGPTLQTIYDEQSVDAATEFIGDYEITEGEYTMRSAAFNIDTSNSEDADEYRHYIAGGQNQEDWEAKMIAHNLPSARTTYYDDVTNDVTGDAVKRATGIRDFRKIYYQDTPAWFDGAWVFDPFFRVHDHCQYYDGIDWWGTPTPTALTEDFNAASKQIQRVSGMPNVIPRAIAQRFSSSSQCKLKATVGLEKFSPNHVGSSYLITLPGRFSIYSGTYWLRQITVKASKSQADVELIRVV